jgi:hypothetical protein
MRRLSTLAVSSACAALFVATALAQSQPPALKVSVTLEPATATVGDHLTFTITVDHSDGIDIIDQPTFGDDFGGLELLQVAPPAQTQLGPGLQRTTFAYTLASFETGVFTVPAMRLGYNDHATPGGVFTTEARSVRIDSVLAPGDTTLRPLKPQLDIPEPAPSPAVPAAFVAAMALLTAAGYVLYVRAVRIVPPALAVAAPAPSVASPHDRARASLDALARSNIAGADPAEHYARLAGIVRRYLSERYGFAAFAMTHTEMERGMAAAGIDRWPTRVATNLLEQCEAVEFAAFRPAPARLAADLAAAYELIALTSEPQPSLDANSV